ncbi:hypothetical protein [Runella rosea]|uniref:hypothetical protein n=1 Tax=Runella rosea TaxID=2259595 RepID=UPI0013B35CD1|nr:hypothetical protein [Runella rosea]
MKDYDVKGKDKVGGKFKQFYEGKYDSGTLRAIKRVILNLPQGFDYRQKRNQEGRYRSK